MIVDILTPDRLIYSGETTSVTVPGSQGMFQILKDHAPIISTLANGKVKIKTNEGDKVFEVEGGVVEVLKNKIIVLVERVLGDEAA
ncbi:UNVERIFIED_CONTAM: hypothetical protein GTU68_033212 [Idotea baltica]|nr:hypothetical protein [Idotea baltica]